MSTMKRFRNSSLLNFRSPGWLCRLRRHFISNLPKVYGPRGMVLLGYSLLAASFGLAYVGVLNNPLSPGLELVRAILPMPMWGVAWFLSSFTLAAAAFRVDHAKALGGVTGLLLIWAVSYLFYFITKPSMPDGRPNLAWLSAVIFLALVIACMGVARMLNHAPSHPEIVEKPGPANE